MSRDDGVPYINLMLAELGLAKQDSEKGHANSMWTTFKNEFIGKGENPDPMEVAWWVADFMKNNGVAECCQTQMERGYNKGG